MATTKTFGDAEVSVGDDQVATVEIRRPPDNFFDVGLITSLADAYFALDDRDDARAIVLCSEGKHFCAGADFGAAEFRRRRGGAAPAASTSRRSRLFDASTPVVAAVQGAAIGGGLGLACSADFRVASPQARFAANFARLGFHQGFGLTVTLPAHRRPAGGRWSCSTPAAGSAGGGGRDRPGRPAGRARPSCGRRPTSWRPRSPRRARWRCASIRETMRGDLAGRVGRPRSRRRRAGPAAPDRRLRRGHRAPAAERRHAPVRGPVSAPAGPASASPLTEEELRAELKEWLGENWDPGLSLAEWRVRLADAGWAFPGWPSEWGGRGLPVALARLVPGELAAATVPGPPEGVGVGWSRRSSSSTAATSRRAACSGRSPPAR